MLFTIVKIDKNNFFTYSIYILFIQLKFCNSPILNLVKGSSFYLIESELFN